jgi:hypothetical protein
MNGVVHSANLWASYIWPAYILTVGGLVALLGWAFVSMARAEKRSDELKRR